MNKKINNMNKKINNMNKKINKKSIQALKKEADALWAWQVKGRDVKCVLCGSVEKLHAHHWYKAKSRSLKYRWDVRNGVTLCYACHLLKVHKLATYDLISIIVEHMLTKKYIPSIKIFADEEAFGSKINREFVEHVILNLKKI